MHANFAGGTGGLTPLHREVNYSFSQDGIVPSHCQAEEYFSYHQVAPSPDFNNSRLCDRSLDDIGMRAGTKERSIDVSPQSTPRKSGSSACNNTILERQSGDLDVTLTSGSQSPSLPSPPRSMDTSVCSHLEPACYSPPTPLKQNKNVSPVGKRTAFATSQKPFSCSPTGKGHGRRSSGATYENVKIHNYENVKLYSYAVTGKKLLGLEEKESVGDKPTSHTVDKSAVPLRLSSSYTDNPSESLV